MKKRFFICAILFLGIVSLFGQGRHCLAEIKYRQRVIDNPVLIQERAERKALLDAAITKSSAGKNST
ncbi:MAG: hypothetical protein KJP00_08515, partial [Bacteroidia bacterium]|nr:hypothetical protein [Bacteroidia bacterium]